VSWACLQIAILAPGPGDSRPPAAFPEFLFEPHDLSAAWSASLRLDAPCDPHISPPNLEFHHGKHHALRHQPNKMWTGIRSEARVLEEGDPGGSPVTAGKAPGNFQTNRGPMVWNHTSTGKGSKRVAAVASQRSPCHKIYADFRQLRGLPTQFSRRPVPPSSVAAAAWLLLDGGTSEAPKTPTPTFPSPMVQKALLTNGCSGSHAYLPRYKNRVLIT